jgi:hypothetical protein
MDVVLQAMPKRSSTNDRQFGRAAMNTVAMIIGYAVIALVALNVLVYSIIALLLM